MSTVNNSVTASSQKSFIRLLRHIIFTLGVKNVVFSRKSPSFHSSLHSEFPRIDMVLSGVKHMRYPGDRRVEDAWLKPGEMHYCPPQAPKLPIWDSAHEMSSIVFAADFTRITYINLEKPTTRREIIAPYFYHTAIPAGESARKLCSLLNHQAEQPSRYGMAIPLMEALLRQVLAELEQDTAEYAGKKRMTWLQASNYLHENFTSPINRAHVARVLNLSPGYLSQLFVDECGETFVSYLRRLRLGHANRLLSESSYSIDEITSLCGYQSSTFFIAAFRKQYGLPPGRFRERQRREFGELPGETKIEN